MANAATPYRARLDIVSDVVCPWCYIGKHRLARALDTLDGALELDIHWQPYELNPTLPATGMERRAYCEAKFGSLAYAEQIYARIAASAADDGLPIAVERIARTPNTRRAHRLIELAGEAGAACQDAVVDALFQAYFADGRDVGDVEVLLSIASDAGLDAGTVRDALDDGPALARIEREERSARAMGIDGVPAFLFNGRLLFTGAQSPETIARALERAAAKGL